MVYFPDNLRRAGRLQQLLDSLNHKQANTIHFDRNIRERFKAIQPLLAEVLNAQGGTSPSALFKKNQATLAAKQLTQFEAVMASAKKLSPKVDWESFAGAFMIVPPSKTLDATSIMGIGAFTLRAATVRAIAQFLNGESGPIDKKGANALIEISEETEGTIKKSLEGVDISDKFNKLVQDASTAAGELKDSLTLQGVVNFVAKSVSDFIKLITTSEKEQRDQLVSAIQELQPARLTMAYFEWEAQHILQQLRASQTLLETMLDDRGPGAAAVVPWLSERLILEITSATLPDWYALENSMKQEDQKSDLYFGQDDLPTASVVRIAQEGKVEKKDDGKDDEKDAGK